VDAARSMRAGFGAHHCITHTVLQRATVTQVDAVCGVSPAQIYIPRALWALRTSSTNSLR
jgi:hypothetical protein